MYQPQPQYQPEPQKGLETHFIAKEKVGLFLMLCAAVILVGFLMLDLIASGLVDFEEAILFLGMLAVDAGIVALITLILVSGVCREDLPEKVRTQLIFIAGVLMVFFIIVYLSRAVGGIFGGF
jgi:hypothetical protein